MSDTQVDSAEAVESKPSPPSSPLLLIRQKELEISGHVLAARREADAVLADSRKRAAEIVARASERRSVDTTDQEQAIRAEAQAEIERAEAERENQVSAIRGQVGQRRDRVADMVLAFVLGGKDADE